MSKRVVIAGGGTGGHLYPGIALARELMEHDADIEIVFVGTERGIESRVLPKEGLALKTIASAGLIGKRGMNKLISAMKLPVGALQAMGFLIANRPRLVVGVGGYVSGPVLAVARLLSIPTLIHEQNAWPGVTNRILGKWVDRVCISFDEARSFFPDSKVVMTGNMIRKSFSKADKPQQADPAQPLNVLVLGGSQGARSINRAVTAALEPLAEFKNRVHWAHQTGEADAETVRQSYEAQNWQAEVAPFFFDMESRYRQADLVICRSGATTLAEITACGKPSVLVPFPYATHNHQEKNARVLEAAGAGVVILDSEVDGGKIAAHIKEMLQDTQLRAERARASFALGRRDATRKVMEQCLQLIEQRAA